MPRTYPSTTSLHNHPQPNSPRPLHLSPDGTVLLAHSEDLYLRSFVLPPDLVTSPPPLALDPYSTIGPIQSHTQAIPPYFSLSDPNTTHVLLSLPDLPLRLTNALDLSHNHATYPLIHPPTEAFIAPHSLVFSTDGIRFAAGSKARISIFDLARDAQGPVSSISTAQERRRSAGSGLHGCVIALDACAITGQLAAGSTSGEVGVYDARDAGREVVSFDVGESRGVGQVKWIGEGTYLAIAGRKSQGLALWDLRMARRLCWLAGRKGGLAMRMGFDFQQTEDGCHILAGGTDGVVRIWKDVVSREGTRLHEGEWKAHDDAVTSVLAHSCGDVVITAGGSRKDMGVYECDDMDAGMPFRDGGESTAGIKAWSLPPQHLSMATNELSATQHQQSRM